MGNQFIVDRRPSKVRTFLELHCHHYRPPENPPVARQGAVIGTPGRDDPFTEQPPWLPGIDATTLRTAPPQPCLLSKPDCLYPSIYIRTDCLTATVTATQAHNHDSQRTAE